MCTFMAVAGLAIQTVSDYMQQQSAADSYQRYMNRQADAAIKTNNYNNMALEQQRTDAFDRAVAEISNTRLNSLQLNSGVKAAVNETMEGRTANLLVRSAEGDTARAVTSIKDNYARKSNEVDLNKERNVKSTQSYLESLNASAPQMPSRLTNFVNFGVNAVSAYTTGRNEINANKVAKSGGTEIGKTGYRFSYQSPYGFNY